MGKSTVEKHGGEWSVIHCGKVYPFGSDDLAKKTAEVAQKDIEAGDSGYTSRCGIAQRTMLDSCLRRKRTDQKIWEPHTHKCLNKQCASVWFHDPIDVLDTPNPQETHYKAHVCPNCGHHEDGQGWIDDSGTKPQYLHNGVKTEPITKVPRIKETEETQAKRAYLKFMARMSRLLGI